MDISAAPEILLIDKPEGISSFQMIKMLRRKYGIRKMGHSGTLDPLASGLLVVGVGKGTKKLKDLIGLPKVYEAEVVLGIKTSTGDREGEIVERTAIKEIDRRKIKIILAEMKGELSLPVPLYSAIKVKGERLYKMARRGKPIPDLPVKTMEIFWIKSKKTKKEDDTIVIPIVLKVKSGTYIRSVAEEIGRRLGLPAYLKKLRRISIGAFKVKKAIRLNSINFPQ